MQDISNAEANSPRTLSFLAIDADMGTNADPGTKLLGTDFMFAISFFRKLYYAVIVLISCRALTKDISYSCSGLELDWIFTYDVFLSHRGIAVRRSFRFRFIIS